MLGQACAHCPIFPTAASRRSLDRLSVPVWPISLSARLPIVGLVGRCPANHLMGRGPILQRISPLTSSRCRVVVSCGISSRFQLLSPSEGQVAHALLTRPPLAPKRSFDLHVLGTPPAFVLSQDQTLEFNLLKRVSPFRSLNRLVFSSQLTAFSLFMTLFVITWLFLVFALYSFQGAPPRSPRDSFCILHPSLPSCQQLFPFFLKKFFQLGSFLSKPTHFTDCFHFN